MVSEDFKRIMQLVHTDKYRIAGTNIHYERKHEVSDSPFKASITLEKQGISEVISTSEFDCIRYITQLRSISNTGGEVLQIPIKNAEGYDNTSINLVEDRKEKTQDALYALKSGDFIFEYSPHKLIDELLESPPNLKTLRNEKFSPLLEDYFHILALYLLQSKQVMEMSNQLEKKFPEIKELVEVMGWIQAAFSFVTKNPIKNYNFYRNYANYDSDALFEQLSSQLNITGETIIGLVKQGNANWKRDIPKMMDMYTRCIEPSRPLINILRVGLELRQGVKLPEKDFSLGQNIKILQSDSKYGSLFTCLDEQIRHGHAHMNTYIKGDKVEIRNGITRKAKAIRIYKCNEIINLILDMRQQFLPALMIATIINDYALLDQVLMSVEYQMLLASLGNC